MTRLVAFCRCVAAGLLLRQAPPSALRLDAAGGVGGLRFGEALTPAARLQPTLGGMGKRWRTTKLFVRPGDMTRLGGSPRPPTYWFRQNRFIGASVDMPSAQALQVALARLTAQYGPAHPDTLPDQWYWLGQRSYLLLERSSKNQGTLFVASLAMLNEQVYETAVRARARRLLGWHPDSLGLPRQFPSR